MIRFENNTSFGDHGRTKDLYETLWQDFEDFLIF